MVFLIKLIGGILSCLLLFTWEISRGALSNEHGVDIALPFKLFLAFVLEPEIKNYIIQ